MSDTIKTRKQMESRIRRENRPDRLNRHQLESRIRFHQSVARMFAREGDERMAQKFRELVAAYQAELAVRDYLPLKLAAPHARTRSHA